MATHPINCRKTCDIPVMGMAKQANNQLFINVTDPIVGCMNINAKNYASITSTVGGTPSASYKVHDRPEDQLNCPEPLCITTGTLYVNFSTTGTDPDIEVGATSVTFFRDEAALDYVNGAVTGYVVLTGAGSYEVKTTVGDRCGGTPVEFTDTFVGGEDDIYPKTFLVQHSFEESATVLEPSDCGMQVVVTVTPADVDSAANEVGISSFSVLEDAADFQQNDTIMFKCIDELDLPIEVDLTDPTCLGQAADPDSVNLELSVTAQQVTGNYMRLNPMLHETDETTAFMVECKTKTIGTVTVNGQQFQGVLLDHYYPEECGFLSAYLPACDANDGKLTYNSIANAFEPDLITYKVLQDVASGEYFMVFNEDYAGKPVTITYPVEKAAKVYEGNTNFIEGRRIKVIIPFEYKNGWRGYYMSEDAFVTSFPFGWSRTEDTPMEFTIVFKKHGDKFFKVVLFED